jgi:hypothetical protein
MMCCAVLLEPGCHAGTATALTASAHIDWLASFRGWAQHCQLHCLSTGRMMMPKKQTDWRLWHDCCVALVLKPAQSHV